jgi:arsenite-transporting ATPase
METHRALEVLRKVNLPVQGLVVNRVLPAEADGDFLARRREQEQVHLAEIERRFGGVPRVHLPMLPRDITDRDALEALIRVLTGQDTGDGAPAPDS